MEQSLSTVWKSYGLMPKYVEETGRIQKLYTNEGTFALKKIPASGGMDFIHGMQSLYQSGYHHFVPVYPAADGRYGVLSGENIYYLMPWVNSGNEATAATKEQKMLRETARLHTLSSREIDSSAEEREEHYERINTRWEQQEEQLEQFIELAESETYMSPFQLLYCLYYFEITESFAYAKERLKRWKEATKEEKKARTVRIHGRLGPDHFILDDNGSGYFINLEQSRQATPLHDLIPYFSKTLETYPKNIEAEVTNLLYYMNFFALRTSEKLLFQSYMAYPGAMYQTVAEYFTARGKFTEQQYTAKLQRQYWHMKNIEYMITQIPEDNKEEN